MATIKTLLGNVKGKDGGGYEEVILYDGNCSACINSNIITSSSAMIELSDSIENYKSIRIEYLTYDGRGSGEGLVNNPAIVVSVDYIKTTYGYNAIATGMPKTNSSSNFAFGFYNDKHLAQTWASHGSLPHNMSHIKVIGIRDKVSEAEKNFNKYSTTEEVVGTWIDGKPIYRKVITLSTTKTIGMDGISISHGISNIDIPIDCKGINNTTCAASNLFWVNTKNSTSGTFYNAEGFEGVKFLVFEYTKTTD